MEIGSLDANSVIAMKQAQIQAQAAMKAAKLIMDSQRDQGAQVIEGLVQAADKSMVDLAGRLDVTG